MGNTTWSSYDGWNLPVTVTDALGAFAGDPQHTTTTTYTELGQVWEATDPLVRTTTYQYDNLGRKTAEIDPPITMTLDNGSTSSQPTSPTTYYGYDADGNLKWTTNPRGATDAGGAGQGDWNYTTWYFYDGLNREICVVDPQSTASYSWSVLAAPDTISLSPQPNKSTVTAYNAQGNVWTVTDQLGHMTTYQYDDLDRKKAEVDPSAQSLLNGTLQNVASTTTYTYDANGNVLSATDPDLHTTWDDYDALNRVVKTVSADGSGPNDTHYATITTYDAVGNVTSVTDPDGNVTSYVYDRLNRQIETIDPLHNTSFDVYDLDSNIIQATDADGRTTQYAYNPLNQQVEEDWLAGAPAGGSGSVCHTIDTYYNAAGQVVGVTESDTQNASNATSYEYTYDQDGNVLTSRMAPGDLTQSPQLSGSGSAVSLGTFGSGDWNGDGVQEPLTLVPLASNVGGLQLFFRVTCGAIQSHRYACSLFCLHHRQRQRHGD